jgi:DNA-binding NarL/FixJ family response regulator
MTRVVLFSSDLMVVSRVEGAARNAGMSLQSVATIDALLSHCAATDVALLIVDLSTPSLDVAALVDSVKKGRAPAPAIVAFGPHVHESLLSAARAAGCDEVVSRGQFFAQVEAILRRAITSQAAQDAPPDG